MRWLIWILLILIIIGLWFFPHLTKALVTGAVAAAKNLASQLISSL